tara:strand:- start:305 stop:568 length:264 start_codon:yes stop_codon:yes gene_type:complete
MVLLEMLLVLTLVSSGLVAMLKIYAYNEIVWQRLLSNYCDYLRQSEVSGRQALSGTGVVSDWNENWLQGCHSVRLPQQSIPMWSHSD